MKPYLSNMLSSIKNGQIAKKSIIIRPRKNASESLLKILWDEGFIAGYRISPQTGNHLEIFLKYNKVGQPVINSIRLLSTSSQPVYYSLKQIWKLDSSKTFIIFSTTGGLKSINECKKEKIGGEPLVIIS